MEKVFIRTEYIKMGQVLKLSGILDQGSDAKLCIGEGRVYLNGAPVSERGKKVRPGDVVEVKGAGVFEVAGL